MAESLRIFTWRLTVSLDEIEDLEGRTSAEDEGGRDSSVTRAIKTCQLAFRRMKMLPDLPLVNPLPLDLGRRFRALNYLADTGRQDHSWAMLCDSEKGYSPPKRG